MSNQAAPVPTDSPNAQWTPPPFAPPARNPYARRGFIYALVSIVVNPLLFLSIIAIVLGARGMRNAPRFADPAGARTLGKAALIIGIVTFVVYGALAAIAIPIAISNAKPHYSESFLEKNITASVESEPGVTSASTVCPPTASVDVGSVIECTVTVNGTTVPVYATISDAKGSVTLSTTKP